MKQNKLKQPQALLAGICLLLSTLLWHVCSRLPMGQVNLFSVIRDIFESGDLGVSLDSLFWVLIFFAYVFAGIAFIKADPRLSSIGLIVLGGLFLADAILCLILWFTPRNLLDLILRTAIILAGVTILKRNTSLRTVTVITAGVGFLMNLVLRILIIRMYLNNDNAIWTDSQIIAWIVIVIFANLFLMLGLILACLAVDYGVRPAARGASFTPNMYQPQQPYGQPYMPYAGQPQQPYGQPYMPYAGQPQQPYGGQWQQPYPGQPQPSAQSPAFAGMPQQPFSGQPQQPDPDLEDKTQILPQRPKGGNATNESKET